MWLVACVRCGTLDYQETRANARGRAEVHALGHGCYGHTFYWQWGDGRAFFDVRRAGDCGPVGAGLSERDYASSAERKS
jgi:hypothetical protein